MYIICEAFHFLEVEECRGAQIRVKLPGAYELPKMTKEHATRFCNNPNYMMHFQKFSDFFWYGFNNKATIVSIYENYLAVIDD